MRGMMGGAAHRPIATSASIRVGPKLRSVATIEPCSRQFPLEWDTDK